MNKIGLVAAREFVTTISNRGFIVGLLIMPAVMFLLIRVAPRILNAPSPEIHGGIVVIDPTGQVMPELHKTLDPAYIKGQRMRNLIRGMSESGAASGGPGSNPLSGQGAAPPVLEILERPADAAVQKEKDWLMDKTATPSRLAVVVIHPDAVTRGAGRRGYGAYDLYVSPSLNDETEGVIYEALRDALVRVRLRANNVDQAAIEAAMLVVPPRSVLVAAGGEQQTQRGFMRALPFILGLMLFMGVMIGGQTLMTSTIEEKSSRVVEILLSAVSPIELMAGKLIGQLGVSLSVLLVYIGLGLYALSTFSMLSAVDPKLVLYLIVFFLITYLVYGALMMSIGAAVNQLSDAQSLMGPIMLLLIAPYILAPIIGRAPNSTFSVAVSFVPPVNTFAMIARMASDSPPPSWQIWLTALIGIGAACVTVWFAGKVFKIGLLMHGKPPNFATLIRWAREA
ncbi:MAG TPA: ABC transporter permease [Terriglobia bacterium]|jgi:ABC-2 type transport system permease protein